MSDTGSGEATIFSRLRECEGRRPLGALEYLYYDFAIMVLVNMVLVNMVPLRTHPLQRNEGKFKYLKINPGGCSVVLTGSGAEGFHFEEY